MKLETFRSISLEQQVDYLQSRSLLYRVVYIYNIIDMHPDPDFDKVTDLLLAYKPVLTALRSINNDRTQKIDFKDNKEYKRDRIKRIMKHKDLTPLFRDEKLKQLGIV